MYETINNQSSACSQNSKKNQRDKENDFNSALELKYKVLDEKVMGHVKSTERLLQSSCLNSQSQATVYTLEDMVKQPFPQEISQHNLSLQAAPININVKNKIIKSPTATNWGSTANISKQYEQNQRYFHEALNQRNNSKDSETDS